MFKITEGEEQIRNNYKAGMYRGDPWQEHSTHEEVKR
jgi:hypothetical protein